MEKINTKPPTYKRGFTGLLEINDTAAAEAGENAGSEWDRRNSFQHESGAPVATSEAGGEKAEDKTITNQREVARIKAAAAEAREPLQDEPCPELAREMREAHKRKAARTAAAEVGENEIEKLRRQRIGFDCRYTMGNVADLTGSHCPIDKPCLRCQNERLEAATIERCAEVERLIQDEIEGYIGIWSMRPSPLSNEGKAWETGARQGWLWAIERFAAAIRALKH